MQPFVLNRGELRQPGAQVRQQFPGGILAAVIYDDDFMGHIVQAQFEMQMLDGRADATLLIAGGDNNREQRQRARLSGRRIA